MVLIVPIFRCHSSDTHSVQGFSEVCKDLETGLCFSQELTLWFKHK